MDIFYSYNASLFTTYLLQYFSLPLYICSHTSRLLSYLINLAFKLNTLHTNQFLTQKNLRDRTYPLSEGIDLSMFRINEYIIKYK